MQVNKSPIHNYAALCSETCRMTKSESQMETGDPTGADQRSPAKQTSLQNFKFSKKFERLTVCQLSTFPTSILLIPFAKSP